MTIDYSTTTTEAMYYVVGSPICYGVIHKDKPLELYSLNRKKTLHNWLNSFKDRPARSIYSMTYPSSFS